MSRFRRMSECWPPAATAFGITAIAKVATSAEILLAGWAGQRIENARRCVKLHWCVALFFLTLQPFFVAASAVETDVSAMNAPVVTAIAAANANFVKRVVILRFLEWGIDCGVEKLAPGYGRSHLNHSRTRHS